MEPVPLHENDTETLFSGCKTCGRWSGQAYPTFIVTLTTHGYSAKILCNGLKDATLCWTRSPGQPCKKSHVNKTKSL